MSRPRADLAGLLSASLLFLFLAVAYARLAPSLEYQHWDSLDYASRCETLGPTSVNGNHPLGHVLLCASERVAVAMGFPGRALPVMKAINAIAGAAAAVVFMRVLVAFGVARGRAVGWALVLGVTYGYWHFAGTADIYLLALLALVVAWAAIARAVVADRASASAIAGVALGVALLTHQFAGPLLAAALVAMAPAYVARQRPHAIGRAALGLIVAAIVAGAGYATLGALTLGSTSPAGLWHWIVGYGADPTYGRSLNPYGAGVAAVTSADTIAHRLGGGTRSLQILQPLIVASLIALAIAGIALMRRLGDPLRLAARAAVAQLAIGLPLVVWWEPGHVGKFWLLLLPAFLVLAASGVDALDALDARRVTGARSGRPGGLAVAAPFAIALACVLVNNVTIAREHRPNEPFDQAMDAWIAHTRPGDLLIESEDYTAFLLFWGQRPNTVNIYRVLQTSQSKGDPFGGLKALIDDAIREGRAVVYAPGINQYFSEDMLALVGASRAKIDAFFKKEYRWSEPLFFYENRSGTERKAAYRLERPTGS